MAKFDEKNFGQSADEHLSIKDLLAVDEQIIWQGKPKRVAYILSQVLKMMPIAIIWLLFDGFFIFMMINTGVFNSLPPIGIVFIVVFFALHLLPVWLWLSRVLTARRQYKNTEYVFTNTRVIIKSGVLGVDVNSVYYADITSVNLKVGLLDKLMKVGDIYISGPGKAQVLWDIENPYKTVTRLQKVVNDIKTDTYFPNDLRPNENNGFDTKYKGK